MELTGTDLTPVDALPHLPTPLDIQQNIYELMIVGLKISRSMDGIVRLANDSRLLIVMTLTYQIWATARFHRVAFPVSLIHYASNLTQAFPPQTF